MQQISVPEGAKVAYAGVANRERIDIGDEGKVLRTSGGNCHVIMRTGARVGEVIIIPGEDLTVLGSRRASVYDSLDDGSLDEPIMVRTAVRTVYDRHGEQGLITALANHDELPDFYGVAEEAVQSVIAVVRRHPIMLRVLAELDDEEGENFIQSLAMSAIDEVVG
jgi:hypothetical protein